MIKTLEDVATDEVSGQTLDIEEAEFISIKECRLAGDYNTDLPQYSCDAQCDNCHCATY